MVLPASGAVPKRLGLKSLRTLAARGCTLYVKFLPVIQVVFIENVALLLALEALNVACANVVKEIDAVTTPGV